MMKLTEDVIRNIFGDKTFFRGSDYYNNNHVSGTVKIDNTLYGEVMGSSASPYEVRAFIEDSEVSTRCTCPVGYMCKHGAALLLKWVHEPSSFVDADKFLSLLDGMTKNDIINMIKRLIEHDPSLINEFLLEKGVKPEVNIDAISDRIGWIVHGELDYYHIWDAIQNLEEIKSIADRLKEKELCKDAAGIYLALVKGGVTAYEEGADDSDGALGDFVSECIDDFNECMEQINDLSYKNRLLERILDIVEEEDYGLETYEMLYGIITEENIHHVEEYMLEKLIDKRKAASDFSYKYKKDKTIGLLSDLYEKLGKPGEKLRLAQYELANKEDYARLANVLAEEGRFEEAFNTIKKGSALPGESYVSLNKLYFDLAKILINQKPDLVDFNTSLDVALDMMSRWFNKEEYEVMKEVFYGIGKLEEFKSEMRKRLKNRDYVVQALLHDGDLKAAIDIISKEPAISSHVIVDVSKAARDKGMTKESSLLTRMVLERGWTNANPPMDELLKVMIDVSDIDTLRDLCNRIIKMKNSGTAILLVSYLIKKAPELAASLTKNFINNMQVELVTKVAHAVTEEAPEEGINLCRLKITEDILRSHVYYDKVIQLLTVMRDIYAEKGNESKWLEFIKRFAAENKGKKKLIERLKKEFKVAV